MLLLNKLMQRQGGCKCCSRFLEHKNGRQSRSTGAAVSDVNHSTGQVRSDVPKTAGAQHLLLGVRLRRVRVGGVKESSTEISLFCVTIGEEKVVHANAE